MVARGKSEAQRQGACRTKLRVSSGISKCARVLNWGKPTSSTRLRKIIYLYIVYHQAKLSHYYSVPDSGLPRVDALRND